MQFFRSRFLSDVDREVIMMCVVQEVDRRAVLRPDVREFTHKPMPYVVLTCAFTAHFGSKNTKTKSTSLKKWFVRVPTRLHTTEMVLHDLGHSDGPKTSKTSHRNVA